MQTPEGERRIESIDAKTIVQEESQHHRDIGRLRRPRGEFTFISGAFTPILRQLSPHVPSTATVVFQPPQTAHERRRPVPLREPILDLPVASPAW